MRRTYVALAVAVMTVSCGGGGGSSPTSPSTSSSSPAPTPAPSPAPFTLSASNVTVTPEANSSGGYSYGTTFTLREAGGRLGGTVSSVRVALASASASGGATFDSSNLAGMPAKITGGGTLNFRVSVTSSNIYDRVQLIVSYTDDNGAANTYTSSTTTFSAPAPSPNPAPPAPSPAPSASYAVTLQAVCVPDRKFTGTGFVNYRFNINASGEASSPDVGAVLYAISNPAWTQDTNPACPSWTQPQTNGNNQCKRGASNPVTTAWSHTFTGFLVEDKAGQPRGSNTVEIRANVQQTDNGTIRATRTVTVTCDRF